jgi:hypothetical protein
MTVSATSDQSDTEFKTILSEIVNSESISQDSQYNRNKLLSIPLIKL